MTDEKDPPVVHPATMEPSTAVRKIEGKGRLLREHADRRHQREAHKAAQDRRIGRADRLRAWALKRGGRAAALFAAADKIAHNHAAELAPTTCTCNKPGPDVDSNFPKGK